MGHRPSDEDVLAAVRRQDHPVKASAVLNDLQQRGFDPVAASAVLAQLVGKGMIRLSNERLLSVAG